jgi:Glycosyl transferases group 1
MTLPVIALLGRKDEPTDAVEEYCRYLADALHAHDIDMQIRRVPWEKHGWSEALRALKLQAADWRGKWVFVQYTPLAWSARGFPLKFVSVLKILQAAGARVGIVFHDVAPFSSPRLIDQLRRRIQTHVMRRTSAMADVSVLTVVPEKLSWLKKAQANVVFIPVGPNLTFPEIPGHRQSHECPTIGVFSITGGEQGAAETQTILQAVRQVTQQMGTLHLSVFGRHAEIREAALRQGLSDTPVRVSVEGVLAPADVVKHFEECDVLLFVRKGISTRRSSAIAAIAAGLPIVAYRDPETASPVTDAGVLLVDPGHPEQLGPALVRVLADASLREELSARSRAAYQAYFSWPAIAGKYANLLRGDD